MIIVGIDPGTRCGWAAFDTKAEVGAMLSGVWDLKSGRHEGGGMRYLRFRRYFHNLLETMKPSAVAYEEVRRHMGVDAAHVYGGIISQVGVVCEELKIPYQAIPVATVKKFATGKGNADKAQMMAAAKQRWSSILCEDDNQADAMFIAMSEAIILGEWTP